MSPLSYDKFPRDLNYFGFSIVCYWYMLLFPCAHHHIFNFSITIWSPVVKPHRFPLWSPWDEAQVDLPVRDPQYWILLSVVLCGLMEWGSAVKVQLPLNLLVWLFGLYVQPIALTSHPCSWIFTMMSDLWVLASWSSFEEGWSQEWFMSPSWWCMYFKHVLMANNSACLQHCVFSVRCSSSLLDNSHGCSNDYNHRISGRVLFMAYKVSTEFYHW